MIGIAPLPRFRIYTRPSSYAQIAWEFLTGRSPKGTEVTALEKAISDLTQTPYAIAVPMARSGIYHAIASSIKPGQKVILSPITITDVINMVVVAGGVPLFCDVEPNTCNIAVSGVEKLLEENKGSVGAVLATHLHGLACDIERIAAACQKHGVLLIEDSAQAFSTKVNGKWVGTFGDIGIFSFGMYKNVNAFYGGMVITRHGNIAETIRKRVHALPMEDSKRYLKKVAHGFITDLSTLPLLFRAFTYWIFRYAYLNKIKLLDGMVRVDMDPTLKKTIPNEYLSQMRPLQARLIRKQLAQVEKNNQKRIRAAELYYEGLKDIPELRLPPRRTDGSHLYSYYTIQYEDRHALMRHAMKNRRDFVLSHYHNCAALPCFSAWYRDCPEAEKTAKDLIYLPTYPRYTETEIRKNIRVIRSFFGK